MASHYTNQAGSTVRAFGSDQASGWCRFRVQGFGFTAYGARKVPEKQLQYHFLVSIYSQSTQSLNPSLFVMVPISGLAILPKCRVSKSAKLEGQENGKPFTQPSLKVSRSSSSSSRSSRSSSSSSSSN